MARDYEKVKEAEHQKAWIQQILSQIQNKEWFGSVTIKIEKGVIKRVLLEESLIPPVVGTQIK